MPVDMKQTIAETLAGLLEQKKIEKITVKELVDACHISRQTFYYHFQDIMEVVEYLMRQHLQQALEVSLAAPSPREAVKAMLTAGDREEALLRHLLSSQRREEVIGLLLRFTRAYFVEILHARAANVTFSAADVELAIHFYSYGIVGVLLDGLGKKRDPDILADQIVRLLAGELLGTPERPD